MDLQKLGHKAFTATEGREMDRLLKGRFYQALHPRWQRKLNAPRTDETFAQLYERACMFEQHEKQFTASAACRTETKSKRSRSSTQARGSRPTTTTTTATSQRSQRSQESIPTQASAPKFVCLCHVCREPGHLARHCPSRLKNSKHESPGRSTNSPAAQTSSVQVEETNERKELTEEELESLLARCRLQKEKQMLQTAPEGSVACIKATPPPPDGSVIGPLHG